MTEQEALAIIAQTENEHIERKEAKHTFDIKTISKYVVALANEGGGRIILGVNDKGAIVGTQAFPDINALKNDVRSQLKISRRIRIEVDEFHIGDKKLRVLIVTVPSRPKGEPISYDGAFLMRSGESLVGMTIDTIQLITDEDISDFSAEIIDGVTLDDLDSSAISMARFLWFRKSGNESVETMTPQEVIYGLGLADERGITRAGIILLGKESTIKRYTANAELVWEYRKSNQLVEYTARNDYRTPFVLYYDDLWRQIESRNDIAHISEGFLIRDIPSYDERAVREAVLNAVSHRDYQDQGSVYIRQSPEEMLIESPGGFIEGITPENIMYASSKPRNRLIAEAFQKMGLVERSGQGVDKIFMLTIATGKGQPSYALSTPHEVKLRIGAQIQDMHFVQYLDRVAQSTGIKLSASDYVLLEKVRLGEINSISNDPALGRLMVNGLIEKSRSGRYTKPILAKRFYSALDKRGEYTRRKGLDKEQKKQLILNHLKNYPRGYIKDIDEALSYEVKKATINYYLAELQKEGKIEFIGNKSIVRGPNRGYWQLKKQG